MPPGLHLLVARKVDGIDKTTGRTYSTFPAEVWRKQHLKGSYYFSTGASDDKRLRRAENMKAVRAIVIDDIGPKVDPAKVLAKPTWVLETSPGNQQWGFMLDHWSTDIQGADELFAGLIAAGLQDPGVRTACRLFRIPDSLNDKPGMNGYTAVLYHFDRDVVYTLKSLAKALKVKPTRAKVRRVDPGTRPAAGKPCPVYDWLQARGDIFREATGGWFDIRCPWEAEHTKGREDGGRLLPSWASPDGIPGVMCQHGHGGIGDAAYRQKFIEWYETESGQKWPQADARTLEHYRAGLQKLIPRSPGVTLPSVKHDDPGAPKDLYNQRTLREALGLIEQADLPYVEFTAAGKPKQVQSTSYENVEAGLEQLGVQPRLNLMDASTNYVLPPKIDPARFGNKDEHAISKMVLAALTDIFDRAKMKNETKLHTCIDTIANTVEWHPMREWILEKPWDRQDRLQALLGTVQTPTPDLWQTYFRRWALQTIEAVCGWATPSRKKQKGLVLVLVGKQRIGKTRWLMALAPDFTKSGKHLNLNGSNSRDSKHEVLQAAITELGELDATFRKSDISALKAFITEVLDEYRLPYAAVWLKRPRCTSFCGSVNEPRFLNDPTGSGRFLGVEVTGRLQVDHAIDMQQFWAQMYTYWEAGEQYWLTDDEERLRDEHAEDFQALDPVAELIEESLGQRQDTDLYPMQAIVGPRVMLDLCKVDSISVQKHLNTATKVLTDKLGKGRDLRRRGAMTHKARWVVNVNSSEQSSHKLTIAKPASA